MRVPSGLVWTGVMEMANGDIAIHEFSTIVSPRRAARARARFARSARHSCHPIASVRGFRQRARGDRRWLRARHHRQGVQDVCAFSYVRNITEIMCVGDAVKRFAAAEIADDASVTTDGHKGYSAKSLGKRRHAAIVQTKAERAEADALAARRTGPSRC